MSGRVAGHDFVVDGFGIEKCSSCGKTWISIVEQREYWREGEKDIAHYGVLNAAEVMQLYAKEERMWLAGKGETPVDVEAADEPDLLSAGCFFSCRSDEMVEF